MDKNTLYYKNISERSLIHFIKGLLPRIICYIKYQKSRRVALKNGAKIGSNSIILKNFAKKCNENFELGENCSITRWRN